MTVQETAATRNEKGVATRYPVTEDLELGTTKLHGRKPYLTPNGINGVKTVVKRDTRSGI